MGKITPVGTYEVFYNLRIIKVAEGLQGHLVQSYPIYSHHSSCSTAECPNRAPRQNSKTLAVQPWEICSQSFTDQHVLSSNKDSISNRLKNENTSEDLESKYLNILKKTVKNHLLGNTEH